MTSGALISNDELYRYTLTRQWAGDKTPRLVNFIMLNPSIADHTVDDPTIRRCMNFARSWEYDGIVVTNLFAFRATKPKVMIAADDPIGPRNDRHLDEEAKEAKRVVVAWGAHAFAAERAKAVLKRLEKQGIVPYALGVTKDGHPRHPLYVPGWAEPRPLKAMQVTQG